MGPLKEELIAWILREVLKGLDYLHSHGIAYSNMTGQHILFSVVSGSLEIKLDHSHAVLDELEVGAVSNGLEYDFDHNYLQVSASQKYVEVQDETNHPHACSLIYINFAYRMTL